MKKLSLALLLLPAYSVMAQMDMDMGMGMHSNKHFDSTVSINSFRNIGVSFQKFDVLNDRIKKFPQYKQMPDAMASLGLGSIMKKGHFVGVNSLTIGYSMSGKKNERSSSLGFIGISADFGYNFFKKESRVELYPTIGIGLEGYRARFNKDVSAVPFDNVLGSNATQNDIRSLTFMNGFITYRAGLNIMFTSTDKAWGVGLQGGYTGSFKDREWRVNNSQVLQNTPKDGLSRIYANLVMTKKLNWGKRGIM